MNILSKQLDSIVERSYQYSLCTDASTMTVNDRRSNSEEDFRNNHSDVPETN
jgi:hypothetical protein